MHICSEFPATGRYRNNWKREHDPSAVRIWNDRFELLAGSGGIMGRALMRARTDRTKPYMRVLSVRPDVTGQDGQKLGWGLVRPAVRLTLAGA